MADKGSEFYNRSMILFLQNNDIEMYSIHNEGKSVVPERFSRTLNTKMYKYMISITFFNLHPNEYSQEFHYSPFTVNYINLFEVLILLIICLIKYVFETNRKI